jgi:hypothetical protein
MSLSLRLFVWLPSSTVKPPGHAVYDATLAERRAVHWVGTYYSSRNRSTLYLCNFLVSTVRLLLLLRLTYTPQHILYQHLQCSPLELESQFCTCIKLFSFGLLAACILLRIACSVYQFELRAQDQESERAHHSTIGTKTLPSPVRKKERDITFLLVMLIRDLSFRLNFAIGVYTALKKWCDNSYCRLWNCQFPS